VCDAGLETEPAPRPTLVESRKVASAYLPQIPPHNIGIGGVNQLNVQIYQQLYPWRSGEACTDRYGPVTIFSETGEPIGDPASLARFNIWRRLCWYLECRLPRTTFMRLLQQIRTPLLRYKYPLPADMAYDEEPPEELWVAIWEIAYLYKVLRADSNWSRVQWDVLTNLLKEAAAATDSFQQLVTYRLKQMEQAVKASRGPALGTKNRIGQQRQAFAAWIVSKMRDGEKPKDAVDRLSQGPNGTSLIPGTGDPRNMRKLLIAEVRTLLGSR
jgi:hypothetical protein